MFLKKVRYIGYKLYIIAIALYSSLTYVFIMSIADLFKKKKIEKRSDYDFTDEDREKSVEVRRIKAELRAIEKESKLDELRAELEYKKEYLQLQRQKKILDLMPEPEQEPDLETQMLSSLLMPLMQKLTNVTPLTPAETEANSSPAISEPAGVSLSDDMLRAYLSRIPKAILKKLKKLSDDDLRTKVIEQFPTIDKNTTERAILLLKS